jgi:CRP-like cAMP-binding protein
MKKLTLTDADAVEFGKMVRKIKFFASMNMGLLERILNRITLFQYEKGEKICRQGEGGDSFYVVYSGRLGVSVKNGLFSFSRRVAELGPGDCFGEMALLTREPRNATVACEEDARLFVLLADNFDQVISENPAFSEEIKKLAAERGFELKRRRQV